MDARAGPSSSGGLIEGRPRGDIACDCIICSLKSKNFSVRSFIEKKSILKGGRPTPTMDITKDMKTYKRHFNIGVYNTHEWLTGCEKLGKLFCWPCLLI